MSHPNASWQRDLQTIFHAGTLAGRSDGELLEQIASHRGAGHEAGVAVESAFALLMERHGPMVLRVCQGVLGDPHEAEDAFQATFLVLLRQAGTIRKRQSVGPWLHGVARRVAACARSGAARRRAHERRWFERRQRNDARAAGDRHDFDLSQTIHAELDRLPERYRAPIVLCDLEERSLDEAARQLGWPLGTVKSRLNRGRQRLRDRLVRRGVAPGIAGAALSGSAAIRPAGAAMAVSQALARATAQMIGEVGALAGSSSAPVAALVRVMERILVMNQLKMAAVVLIAVGLTSLGLVAMAGGPRPAARDDAAAQAAAPREKAARKDDAKPAPPPKPRVHREDGSYLVTIDITGRATDASGRPVAGATIYVIDTNNGRYTEDNPMLSTVTTGSDGRYSASGVAMWVKRSEAVPRPGVEESCFQVAGTARGFGLTWHDNACHRPAARPGNTGGPAPQEAPEVFYQGEPVVLDLVFGAPATLRGKVVDDRGRPLVGAKVQAGLCDNPRRPHGGKSWTSTRLEAGNHLGRHDFHGFHAMPEDLFTTHTGLDGTYRLDGLPREARLMTLIDPGPEYEASSEVVATTSKVVPNTRSLGHDAVLDHTFVAPRPLEVLVADDARQPVRGATIRVKSDRTLLRAGSVGVTDERGFTRLQLRPGEYRITCEPPLGTTYQGIGETSYTMEPDRPGHVVLSIDLHPAAVVILEARDAKTGAGVPGVRFQYETDPSKERSDLSRQPVFVDHPRTDERGQLRAVVNPGRRRFFVATVPPGWRFDGTPSDFLLLRRGEENTVRFAFTKLDEADTAAVGQSLVFPPDLIAKWQRQQGLPRTGKFRIRGYWYSLNNDPIPAKQLDAFLDSTDLAQVPDPAAALQARFPALPKPRSGSREIIIDGDKIRNTEASRVGTSIEVLNGFEVVAYDEANAQADIYGAHQNGGRGVLGFHGLSPVFGVPNFGRWIFGNFRGPNVEFFDGGVVHFAEDGNRMTIYQTKDHATGLWVVDLTTGFVHVHSWRSSRANVIGELVRQYGPKPFRHRFVLPAVHIEAHLEGSQVDGLEIIKLEDINIDYRPNPLDFVVAAPAGTLIIDHRQDIAHPRMGMAHYPVVDAIDYANERLSREPEIGAPHRMPPE